MVQTTISREIYLHQLAFPFGQGFDDGKLGGLFKFIPDFEELNTGGFFHDDILRPYRVRRV